MRRILFRLIRFVKIDHIARFFARNRLTIVLYHGVAPSTSDRLFNYRRKFIAPASFENHIVYFTRHYDVLPLDEAIERLRNGTLPAYALAITFDDGYRNNYDYAFPLLRKYAAPATIFLATDFVYNLRPLWVDRLEHAMDKSSHTIAQKRANDNTLRAQMKKMPTEAVQRKLEQLEEQYGHIEDLHKSPYAPLTTDMISEMAANGITFGAHTVTHPILTQLPTEEAAREITDSRKQITESHGSISTVFAYPNGQPDDWNPEIESILSRAGFSAALTTVPGSNSRKTSRFALKRYSLDDTDSVDSFIATISGFRGILQTLKQRYDHITR